MLVFDIKLQGGISNRVAVVGSCRVRNPLLKLREDNTHGLKWVVSKPPLTHSFNEARQIIRYVAKELHIPDDIAPYIFETPQTPNVDAYPPNLLASVDTFIIEMCDLKQVQFKEFYFQNNYFARSFVRKHASQLLQWYRNFSRGLPVSDDVVNQSLNALQDAGVEVAGTTEAILRHTKIYVPDADTIAADSKKLVFDRSKRWIFFSHFSDPDDQSSVMKDRRDLAASLERAAKGVGAEFFDPSQLIEHYGRHNVLRGNGADIYEYAYEFFPVLGHIMCSILQKGAGGELDFPKYGTPRKPKAAKSKKAPAADPGPGPAREESDKSSTVTALHRPTADDVARTNKLLIKVMTERFEALGLERSGLYSYYKRMLDAGSLVRIGDVKIRDLLLNRVSKFQHYYVLKSGVGSLPVLLATAGLRVTATDPNEHRVDAIRTVVRRLSSGRPAIGRLISVDDCDAPTYSAPLEGGTLAIATGMILTPSNQAELLERLCKFDAVLIEPHRFFGEGKSTESVAAASSLLESAGFKKFTNLPSANLALFVHASRGIVVEQRAGLPLRTAMK